MDFYSFSDYLKDNKLTFFYNSLPLQAIELNFLLEDQLDDEDFISTDDNKNNSCIIADKKLIQKIYIGYCKNNNLAHDLFYRDITAAAFNEVNNKDLIYRFVDFIEKELQLKDFDICAHTSDQVRAYARIYREAYIEYTLMNGLIREYL